MRGSIELNRLRYYLGMQFWTSEDAYNFYNEYGCHVGFSIRRKTTSSSKKDVSSVNFVCSTEGYSKCQRAELKGMNISTYLKTSEREYRTTRTNCKAYLRIKLVNEGFWIVSIFLSCFVLLLKSETFAHKNALV
jgi:FAR1 DNA-binding domain